MTPAEFLAWTVPPGNNYSAVKTRRRDGNGYYFWHKNFTDQGKLASYVQYASAKHLRDGYFALASFLEAEVKNPNGSMRPVRTQENVASLRSLWLDVDAKEAYPDKPTVLRELTRILKETQLPRPSVIVDSGNGIHVYWCFRTDLTPDRWQPIAEGLRHVLADAGLQFDKGVTVDSARVLRLPGTQNFKDPAKPLDVRILGSWQKYDWSAFEYLAGKAPTTVPSMHAVLSAPRRIDFSDVEDMDVGALGDTQGSTMHMAEVVRECPLLAGMLKDNGKSADEPLWKSMLLVAARCDDGREWAHMLSSGHAGYSVGETDKKFDTQVRTLEEGRAGPTTCATFASMRPAACNGCLYNGQIKSPVLLGRPVNGLPVNYRNSPRGVEHWTLDTDEDTHMWKPVTRLQFFNGTLIAPPEESMRLLGEWGYQGSRTQFNIQLSRVCSRPDRALEHANDNGIPLRAGEGPAFQRFVMDWISSLHARQRIEDVPDKIGWDRKHTTFTYRRKRISGGKTASGLFRDERNFQHYHEAGSRSAWDDAVKVMAASPVEHQLLVLISFAAPLAALAGLSGFLFSFYSPETGTGKSTALRMGASVWGDPIRTTHSMQDTPKSVLRRIGITPHLPAYWDEVRSLRKFDFEQQIKVIFELAQGREMSRLKADTSFNSSGDWQTILGIATNESLKDLAIETRSSASPLLARMLEITVPPLTHNAHNAALSALERNYGFVGPEYMEYVTGNQAAIQAALTKVRSALTAQHPDPDNRYWCTACALMVVAAHASRKAGLFAADPQTVMRYLSGLMRAEAKEARDGVFTTSPSATLADFKAWLIDQQDFWIITRAAPTGKAIRPILPLRQPALIHIDLTTRKGLLTTQGFRQLCKDQGKAPTRTRQLLEPAVMAGSRTFGSGTQYSSGQRRCFVFDIDNLGLKDAVRNLVRHRDMIT